MLPARDLGVTMWLWGLSRLVCEVLFSSECTSSDLFTFFSRLAVGSCCWIGDAILEPESCWRGDAMRSEEAEKNCSTEPLLRGLSIVLLVGVCEVVAFAVRFSRNTSEETRSSRLAVFVDEARLKEMGDLVALLEIAGGTPCSGAGATNDSCEWVLDSGRCCCCCCCCCCWSPPLEWTFTRDESTPEFSGREVSSSNCGWYGKNNDATMRAIVCCGCWCVRSVVGVDAGGGRRVEG